MQTPVGSALAGPRCDYCGVPITIHQKIQPGHCGNRNCMTTHAVQGDMRRREERAREYADWLKVAREGTAAEQAQAAALLEVPLDTIAIATVPHQREPLIPLPEARRALFEAHLDGIIAVAFADGRRADHEERAEYESPLPRPVAEAGCRACQGQCCRLGGPQHAFLTRDTIVNLIEAQPGVTAEAVRAYYLGHLPEVSVTDSCVFHGYRGCTLDRDRRAEICNRFYCFRLEKAAEALGDKADGPVAMVAIDKEGRPAKMVAVSPAKGVVPVTPEG